MLGRVVIAMNGGTVKNELNAAFIKFTLKNPQSYIKKGTLTLMAAFIF